MKNNNLIAITVDVEDNKLHSDFNYTNVINALKYSQKTIDKISETFSCEVPVTWFLRCDDTVAQALGKPEGFIECISQFIEKRLKMGDLFGIHPHFEINKNNKWYKENRLTKQSELLERAAEGWRNFFGTYPTFSRMGEAFMNNTISIKLDEIGIKIDSTALPGRKRKDIDFNFDWQIAPSYPYKPSVKDYRVPDSQNSLRFIELPFTMVNILGSNDSNFLKRYFNLAFKKKLIKESIKELPKEKLRLLATFHTHEIVPNTKKSNFFPKKNNDILSNLQNLKQEIKNLKFVNIENFIEINT